jgi:hypothetical protein
MAKAKTSDKPIDCGIVMPISEIDGLSENHWFQVRRVIKSAVLSVGFKGRLVSDSDGANVIVSNIIQNLFFDPIVVCDVSCKNANVMFELGLRLAFDRPVVIIMDNVTKFTFDVSMLQHIIYPRDLRYHSIISFKQELAEKVKATYEDSTKSDYKSFLKHFERLTPSTIDSKDIPQFEYLVQKIDELGRRMAMQTPVVGKFQKVMTHEEVEFNQYLALKIESYLSTIKTKWKVPPTPKMINQAYRAVVQKLTNDKNLIRHIHFSKEKAEEMIADQLVIYQSRVVR